MRINLLKANTRTGITLVELVIVIAIASIVFTAAFTLFDFGQNIYTKGNSQYDLQSNARLAVQQIMKEVRYATEVSILSPVDTIPPDNTSLTANEGYIFYDETNGTLRILNSDTNTAYSIGEVPGTSFIFNRQTSNAILGYSIHGKHEENKYSLGSNILCLNLQLKGNSIGGEATGSAIHYKKELEPILTASPTTLPTSPSPIIVSPSPIVPSPSPVVTKPTLKIYSNELLIETYVLRDTILDKIADSNIESFTSNKCNKSDLFWNEYEVELKVENVGNGYEAIIMVKYSDNKSQKFKITYKNNGGWGISPETNLQ